MDEIQYAKGHKYLTLVHRIDADLTRLLWVGKERTVETFPGFFTMIGAELTAQIEFVLGYVEALSEGDPGEMLSGAPHPGSLPYAQGRLQEPAT